MPEAPKPRPVVRAVPANAKPHIVAPVDFNAAQEVADKFKTDQPVVMDLRMVDGKLARRLLDFSSGVCYSLGGGMEKVGSKVYLLVPEGTEVSNDERRRLYDRGLSD
jgi:cell division inhibitor SepF